MSLTAVGVRNAKSGDKPYKLADSGGLYLLINPQGSKLWRLDYRFDGKRKTLALGNSQDVPLAEAREARDDARKALRNGVDPGDVRKAAKARQVVDESRQFKAVAERWFAARKSRWVEGYSDRIWSRVEADVLPELGSLPVNEVTAEQVLSALRVIEQRGAIETARRVGNYIQDIFRLAKAERLVVANPADDLAAALSARPPAKRRAALKAAELPKFLRDLKSYNGEAQTRLALQLTLLTFVRTSEVRFAQWSEFENLDGAEPLWRIPAERMKMRAEHLVPLSKQAVDVLEGLRKISSGDGSLFPAPTVSGVMSENTMIYALYRMGYHRRATVHGFRGTASTILNEQGFNRDWVERQLAHAERDEVRAAYNAAEWLPQRRKMMAWWADHLDNCQKRAESGTA
jgi:integrase